MQGLKHVNRAARILVGRNVTLHQRLLEAANELTTAVRRRRRWPKRLASKAAGVCEKLTAKGTLDATINGLDRADAREAAEEILSLAINLNAVRAVRRKRRAVHLPVRETTQKRRLDLGTSAK